MNHYQCQYCGRIFKSKDVPDVPHRCKDGFRKRNQAYSLLKVLDLPLKVKWYEMIESGQKKEEYREIKPFWNKRICGCVFVAKSMCEKDKCEYCKEFTHVRFRYGYTNKAMLFRIEGISIGKGRAEWGAPEYETFILKLGKRIY